KLLLITAAILVTAFAFAQDCSDLFISEYVEGSSQNKGIEIYNPTSEPISLEGYILVRFSNGSPSISDELDLSYVDSVSVVQPYDVIFAVNGQTVENDYGVVDPALYALADIAGVGGHGTDPNYFNGDDAVALIKGDMQLVDLVGKIGENPGEGWCDDEDLGYVAGESYWLSWTANHTLIRKPNIKKGVTSNPQFFNPAAEYDSLPIDTWSHVGFHECECDPNYNGIEDDSNVENHSNTVIYPNPVGNTSKVTVMSEKLIKNIQVFNVIGSIEREIVVNERTGMVTSDVSDLDNGVHLMRIQFTDGSFETKQLVIK
nr:lamin tail domain-containing protein [Salinivirgaceae bacterium]